MSMFGKQRKIVVVLHFIMLVQTIQLQIGGQYSISIGGLFPLGDRNNQRVQYMISLTVQKWKSTFQCATCFGTGRGYAKQSTFTHSSSHDHQQGT